MGDRKIEDGVDEAEAPAKPKPNDTSYSDRVDPEYHVGSFERDDTDRNGVTMGIVKHGEGSVLPESEQQKQGSKEGLTKEAVDEIVAEGHDGDSDDD